VKKSLQVSKQQNIVKQQVTEMVENTLPARILRIVGSLIQRVTRQATPPPWYISTLFLEIITVLPKLLITLIFREPQQVIGSGLAWTLSTVISIPVIPFSYLTTRYALITIRDHVIDRIEERNELYDLQTFLSRYTNQRRAFYYALITSIIWSITAISFFSFFNHGYIGLGFSIDVWIFGFPSVTIMMRHASPIV